MAEVHKVLSIDGCGFRGLTQLLLLNQLMQRLGDKRGGNPPRPCEVFDLICGTAAGGLVALLVGRLGMDCKTAINTYNNLERDIFEGRVNDIATILTKKGGFNTDTFRKSLLKIVEDVTGKDNTLMRADDKHTRKCKTFVTVSPQTTAPDADVNIIRSYPRPKNAKDPDSALGHHWTIQEAAAGTTRCPLLFFPFKLETDLGDLVFQGANASGFSNPSMIAYIEALDLFGNDSELTFISLGMGLRNLHDYSEPSPDDINSMIENLGGRMNTEDDRLREFARQTRLVATSTRIKDLRVADRMHRSESVQNYYRLDPPRDGRPFVFVDYGQQQLIGDITKAYFKDRQYSKRWTDAVGALQRAAVCAWKWLEVRGYTNDSDPVNSVNGLDPTQIMGECYEWEKKHPGQYISCFTDTGDMMTGPISPSFARGSQLYVRVLVDDNWRFIPQRAGIRFRNQFPVGNGPEFLQQGFPTIETIQIVQGESTVKGFNARGFYTTDVVNVNDLRPAQTDFTQQYQGTWIRRA
ncbi:acyl transferase/acyl hydrolase/lysophospholipase [Hygrophoropsis aurantiaca]|uniref:Acyl transferase/acyl hydrolase/lysophospholipase n=1 Tax=Hygrophoropsis aurantiaca TaxID=72124 RepID=A0ACB8A3J5_9AGAM|nr:acyl transferase/acyl hydrolase/lysophospholipase [Hygrophoropsis aurantiaca]